MLISEDLYIETNKNKRQTGINLLRGEFSNSPFISLAISVTKGSINLPRALQFTNL
jgi:hypothetical protein